MLRPGDEDSNLRISKSTFISTPGHTEGQHTTLPKVSSRTIRLILDGIYPPIIHFNFYQFFCIYLFIYRQKLDIDETPTESRRLPIDIGYCRHGCIYLFTYQFHSFTYYSTDDGSGLGRDREAVVQQNT